MEQMARSNMKWVKALQEVPQVQVIGIDGKQMRGSPDQRNGERAIYMDSAWVDLSKLKSGAA